MKRGADGLWRTVGGIVVSPEQQVELSTKPGDVVHKLFIVDHKYPPRPIQEVQCRIVITDKISWAEPIMPLKGRIRFQKRFMLGAYAFYTRNQAEKKKVLMLAQSLKAWARQPTLANDSRAQLEHFKATGELP